MVCVDLRLFVVCGVAVVVVVAAVDVVLLSHPITGLPGYYDFCQSPRQGCRTNQGALDWEYVDKKRTLREGF